MNDPTNATPAEQLAEILKRVEKFRDCDLAMTCAARPPKRLQVMLGDDGCYWLATPADCARLERLGYEYAD